MSITGSLLEKIVNESLNDGEVTDILKISTVGPVPKTNRPKTAEDKSYSERSTDEDIEDNELVSKWQSAYRKMRSCETAPNLVIADWKDFKDKGESILCV